MNKKKAFIRIGTILVCVLLVCVLAVPCFADDNFTGNITDDYYSAFIDTNIPDIYHDNGVLMGLINNYRNGTVKNAGSNGLFGCSLLCYSAVTYDADSSRPGAFGSDYFLGEDTVIAHRVDLEFIVMELTTDGGTLPLSLVLDDAQFGFSLERSGDDVSIEITLTGFWEDRDEIIHESVVVFSNINGTYSSDQTVTFAGRYECEYYEDGVLLFTRDVTEIETAYTVKNYLILGTPITGVGSIQTFLLSENQTTYYHPLAFANGYFAGKYTAPTYEEGYNDGLVVGANEGYLQGLSEGYSQGKNDWYPRGYDEGYDAGYDAGASNPDSYNQGYQAAVEDIDSGDFGRNLLGGMFSAPMDALGSFTLVSWQLSNGETISISLGSIISAILGVVFLMWFLKLFAGG